MGPEVHRRDALIRLPDGETAQADERFFLVRVDALTPATDGWSPEEREVMVEHRWWSQSELAAVTEQVWPEDLAPILQAAGVWPA